MKKSILIANQKKLKILITTDYEEKKKKNFSFSRFFFFLLKYTMVIQLVFWKIISEQIANKLFQKTTPLVRRIMAFKTDWIKRNFSVKNFFQFNQRELFRVSLVIQNNIITLLKLFGSIFFVKLFPHFKNFYERLFENKVFEYTNKFHWRLTEFLKTRFFSKFHYIKTDLLLKINSKVLLVADVWLLYDNWFLGLCPWWRRFRIRECELEYVCEIIVSTVCTSSRRKIF